MSLIPCFWSKAISTIQARDQKKHDCSRSFPPPNKKNKAFSRVSNPPHFYEAFEKSWSLDRYNKGPCRNLPKEYYHLGCDPSKPVTIVQFNHDPLPKIRMMLVVTVAGRGRVPNGHYDFKFRQPKQNVSKILDSSPKNKALEPKNGFLNFDVSLFPSGS